MKAISADPKKRIFCKRRKTKDEPYGNTVEVKELTISQR